MLPNKVYMIKLHMRWNIYSFKEIDQFSFFIKSFNGATTLENQIKVNTMEKQRRIYLNQEHTFSVFLISNDKLLMQLAILHWIMKKILHVSVCHQCPFSAAPPGVLIYRCYCGSRISVRTASQVAACLYAGSSHLTTGTWFSITKQWYTWYESLYINCSISIYWIFSFDNRTRFFFFFFFCNLHLTKY